MSAPEPVVPDPRDDGDEDEQGRAPSESATDAAAEASFELAAASAVLPPAVTAVLEPAHSIALTSKYRERFDATLTTRAARQVLDMIVGMATLRVAITRKVDLTDTGEGTDLATQLLSPDDGISRSAADRIKGLLDTARSDARRARRRERAADKPTAEERAVEREQSRLHELREDRDRARARADNARAALERSEADISDLVEEFDEVLAQRVAAEHSLEALREELKKPEGASNRLLDSLQRELRRLDPVNGEAPGEKVEVVTPYRDAEPPATIVDRLVAAAEISLSDVMDQSARSNVVTWLPKLLDAFANPPRLESFTELDFTVDVLGGGDHIGGSCVLITAAGTRILVDCGTRPTGDDDDSAAPKFISRALEGPLHAIIVTHAHNDHAGWVPAIVKARPNVVVIATQATADLLATMWEDSAKVLDRHASSGRWKSPMPPYSRDDAVNAHRRVVDLPLGRPERIGELSIELFDAGHIVGAAGVVITAGEHRVVVTGDVSGPGQQSVGGFRPSQSALSADLVLLESTYAGQPDPDSRRKVVNDFVRTVEQTVENGGIALVPAFALGRAQEIALVCAERLPELTVMVDGMARQVSEIYERYNGPDGNRIEIFRGNVKQVGHMRTVDAKLAMQPGVVISTSGMMTSGPVVEWAKRVLPDPRSSLMLVGYQDKQSPGAKLMKMAEEGGGGTFSLPNHDDGFEEIEVQASVHKFGLGAHASATELVGIADRLNPGQLMLVHGDGNKQRDLARRMMKRANRMVWSDQVWQPGG